MSVTGDFAKLARLAGALATVHDKNAQLARGCADASVRLNRFDFAGRHGPNGESWAPGRYFHGLYGKGKLAGGFRPTSTDLSFGVKNSVRWGWYHDNGAVLRDGAPTTKFRRTRKRGPGRGRSGPSQRLKFAGPIRKGRERGFLPQRPIMARGDIPSAWRPTLDAVADRHYQRALGGTG